MSDRPRKADDFEVNAVPDGFVVYHPAQDRVHYLNHTAAVVLELSTGEHDAAGIARELQRAYDLSEPPDGDVAFCLERLRAEGLVC